MSMSRLDGILFNPRVNNTLAALDDSKSMFSVAARDLLDSSGRTLMEYKRDKHGGRERLLEEFFTFVIWGFGVRAMKQLYDTALLHAPGLKKIGIELPDLDIDLLSKTKQGGKDTVHTLDAEVVEDFKKKYIATGEKEAAKFYTDLEKVVREESLQRLYRSSSVAKFVVASAIPAVAIAFGVPTFNQWLTRQKVAKEKTAKENIAKGEQSRFQAVRPWVPHPGMSHPAITMPGVGTHPQPVGPQGFGQMTRPGSGYAANPAATNAWPAAMGMHPFTAPKPPQQMAPYSGAPNPWAMGAANAVPNQFTGALGSPAQAAMHRNGQVRFGGIISDGASMFLQNERWNTLLIDGTISGGRVYKARNTAERIEIFFREAAIISFLYWLQRPIQNRIGNWLGKRLETPSHLEFKTIQHLYKQKRYHQNPGLFAEELEKGLKALDWDNLAKASDKEKQLINKVQDYFLHHRDLGANKTNMILEAAIDGGWIPTFHKEHHAAQTIGQKLKAILHDINPVKEQQLTNNPYLDLTKKIETDSVFSLVEHLKGLSQHGAQELEPLLKRTMRLRAGAWFMSNAFCFTFLSIIIPLAQHYITYKRTGKNYFPGVQQS